VWAQLGARQLWWPAIVINAEDCGQASIKEAHCWVFWFGDHKVSQVCCLFVMNIRRLLWHEHWSLPVIYRLLCYLV